VPDSLPERLREAARLFPSRPAVAQPARAISYAELARAASHVAEGLARLGVARGARVGILRRKDIVTVVAIHGVMAAGCAYVPLDPRMGEERLAAIIRDAGMPLVLTEESLAPRLAPAIEAGELERVDRHDLGDRFVVCREARGPAREARDGDEGAAYVLYTSGSTGVPKGVEHTHASALAFVSWAADYFGLTGHDRLSCHAPLHFDLTTFDLFASLLKGACVVLMPDDLVMFPQRIAALMAAERISVWYSVPFALVQLVDRGALADRALGALRHVIFAGERYPPAALRRLASALPHARLTNLFGPTETNVCTYHEVTSSDLGAEEFCPIGRPCPYAITRTVDEHDGDVPIGARGELLVGGGSVMRGYVNRPELNARVFQSSSDGSRLYRTGDVVAAQPDGVLRFHGRRDRQAKVRGFRLELDEIEAAILRCPGVSGAAVWIERGPDDFSYVAAAVERARGAVLSESAVVERVARRLAPAAVPHRVIVMDRLPRTANDKVDYATLTAAASPGIR
jgi:amino acid adenylation domain-containing protein